MKTKPDPDFSLSRDQKIRLALLAGAVLLLVVLLPLRIPVLQILIVLLVAYLAFTLNDPGKSAPNLSLFADVRQRPAPADCAADGSCSFRYVFSNAVLDLTDSAALPERLDIQAVFSAVSVRLPVDAAVTIRANGAFCSICPPAGQNVVFGGADWRCGSQDARAPGLHVDANCVFGQISFRMG